MTIIIEIDKEEKEEDDAYDKWRDLKERGIL